MAEEITQGNKGRRVPFPGIRAGEMAAGRIRIIDIHAHILPGVDDGARDWEESREMLREAYRQGIRHIVATPHYSRDGLPGDLPGLAERLEKEALEIAPDYRISLGQETYYHEGLVENLREGKGLTLAGSRYVLVEFDPGVPYPDLFQAVRKMTMARYIPVIAHMERYACLREDENLPGLLQCDCRLQMNYSSLEGKGIWDREALWCRRQVMEGRIWCLGTDMHRMDYRKPDMEGSLRWLVGHVNGSTLHALLHGNARGIVQPKQMRRR